MQSTVKRFVFATDFSESACIAGEHAAFVANAYEANLHVVYVADSPLAQMLRRSCTWSKRSRSVKDNCHRRVMPQAVDGLENR